MPTCPECRRFLAEVTAYANVDGIDRVTGYCKKHGWVEPDDWEADMFDVESDTA